MFQLVGQYLLVDGHRIRKGTKKEIFFHHVET